MGGFSRALIEDLGPRLEGEERDSLDQIIAASARMANLIDGILQLSRITRGELTREWVDLSALAALIRQELERGEPGRSAVWDLEAGLTAWGDRRLLEALLRNLLGNAWKFASRADPARIALRGLPGGYRFQVADNGAGFDMAYADKLFKPFQRMHRQDEFPGMGIGLATVQRIVGRHGGTLEADAEPGKGARFVFTLPGPEHPEVHHGS
jgi:signal transduction histidine kinase